MSLKTNLLIWTNLREENIFSGETSPPYLNPHNYPLNDNDVPLVPRDDVVSGGFAGERTVFRGGFIVSTSENSFVVRKEMGGPLLKEGDLFAFENANPQRNPLVFEVTNKKSKFSGSYTVETRDIGFLRETSK